ncbi:MAG: hypothetical protein JSW26_09935 [Desulfobacterales bacterium]|nr:MAG: hypothetical protein JSW26_09935 [Desulfobacterales bacterium]
MNIVGIIMAFLLLGGTVFGMGYGAIAGYGFLSVQWGSLSNEWKAALIVSAVIFICCTLLASLFIRSVIKQYGLKGTGKVLAYNDFVHWYSAIKSGNAEAIQAEPVKPLTNQMILWGGKQVARQASLLHELLQKNQAERDQILKKAEHVYIEIRRDLGLRGTSGDNAIV